MIKNNIYIIKIIYNMRIKRFSENKKEKDLEEVKFDIKSF